MEKNYRYFIALNNMVGVGSRTILRLFARWPNLAEMFLLSTQQLIKTGMKESLARAITACDFAAVDADLRWQEGAARHLLTFDSPEYPALLKEIADPPAVLYAVGNLSCLQKVSVAIVGTRKPSSIGRETARQFAYDLAVASVTVVSGLALGIDAAAHQGCIDAGGQTVAVMGTGIDVIYPARHVQLAERICAKGLLLTEFPRQTAPLAGHFPCRNRIISGLSSATTVIEAAVKSGSLITARCALEQNRDVLAVPGSIHNPQARGCHYLLQQGARLVTSSKDVLAELMLPHNDAHIDKALAPRVDANIDLDQCIGFEVTTVDQIMVRSGCTSSEVMSALATWQIQDLIRAVPGGYMRYKL